MKLLLIVSIVLLANANALRTVCYYSNQAQFRNGKGKLLPQDIDPNLCTHIIFAYAKPVGLELRPTTLKDESTTSMQGLYAQLMTVKQKNPNVKILLSVGGSKVGSSPFSPVVETDITMSTFANNAVVFLRERKFDGLDVAWEYRSQKEKPYEYLRFIEELRKTFTQEGDKTGKARLMLTVALPASPYAIDKWYYVANVSRIVDFISVMSVNLHNFPSSGVGFSSPLYAHPEEQGYQLNVDWVAKYYESLGVPKDLLNIAISIYGQSYTLRDAVQHSFLSPFSGQGKRGPYSRTKGILGYYEVCDMAKDGLVVEEPIQKNSYVVKGDQWVGYDDVQSVTAKACYISKNGYGGIVIWSIDFDDFLGTSCAQGKFPLLTAAYTVMSQSSPKMCEADVSTTAPPEGESENASEVLRSVCYYSNVAQFRIGRGKLYPEFIDPTLCTHIIYAFAKLEGLGLKFSGSNDESTLRGDGLIQRVLKLKKINPNVKILLSVGGSRIGSTPFIPLVVTTGAMAIFANNVILYLRERKFDGLDMAWEYPGAEGEEDIKPKFQRLMEELMNAFIKEGDKTGKTRLMLTVAVPAIKSYIDAGYSVANLSRTVDFISIMSVNLHSSLESGVGFSSPLYAHPEETGAAAQLNVDWVAKYYELLGAPPKLLNIAFSTYGLSFTLKDPTQHTILSPVTGKGKQGPFTKEEGILGYYEVCSMAKDGHIVQEASQNSPYVVKDNQWVGYEDFESVKAKVCYVKQNGYGGIVIWTIDYDDFLGTSCNQGRYPLLTAAYKTLQNKSVCPREEVTTEVTTPDTTTTATPVEETDTFRFVCYYNNLAQYRPGKGQFLPEHIDLELCTHILYGPAIVVDCKLHARESNDEDSPSGEGMYTRITNLKKKKPNLKVVLSLGSQIAGSDTCIQLVETEKCRKTFAENAAVFLRENNFDGLDVDWWSATQGGGSKCTDKHRFPLLIEEIKLSFEQEAEKTGKERLLITATVPPGKSYIDKGFDVKELARVADYLTANTQNYHGPWETFVGFNSPMFAYPSEKGEMRNLNLNWTAQYYVHLGAPKEKLNIAIATFGSSFTLDKTFRNSVYSKNRGPGKPYPYTRKAGSMAYYEVCQFIHNEGAKIVDVPSQGNRYAFKGTHWAGYDDVISVKQKACYVRSNGFGGIVFWTVDGDDFDGHFCNNGKYPLIKAAMHEAKSLACHSNKMRSMSRGWSLVGNKGYLPLFVLLVVLFSAF